MSTFVDEQLVEKLVDLSPTNESKFSETAEKRTSKAPKTSEGTKELSGTDTNVQYNSNEHKEYSRLCGYLNKLGNRAILKTYKKRWFVFSENNCKLYYYRSPQDPEPLGEIDISQATFTFDINNERPGIFTIRVPGRDYFLEARNQKTALFWLQELHKYRRIDSSLRTKHINQQTSSFNDFRTRPQSGLLAQSLLDSDPNSLLCSGDLSLMSPIECPKDGIGDDCASPVLSPFSSAQQKFNSFCTQVKNTAHLVKLSPDSQPNSIKESLMPDECSVSESSGTKSSETDGIRSSKSPSLSSLRHRLSQSFRKSHPSEEETGDTSSKMECVLCKELKEKVEELEEEISNLQVEVATSQEVRSVLQRQLNIASKEKETLVKIYQLNESSTKLLNDQDQHIVNLTHDVQELKQAEEKLLRSVDTLKSEVKDLQSNNEMFQEMLKQKDQTIINLTNEIFEIETERHDIKVRDGSSSLAPEPIIETKDNLSYEDLKDAVQAFELQNKFLNSEILELNQLRRDSEDRVQLLTIKCSEWEARSYQIQSKLLFLLNELKRNDDGKCNAEIISQLLEEAVGEGTEHTTLLPSWSREKRYDKLGFNYRWGKEDDLLSLKASNFKQKSEDINKIKDPEIQVWRAKWDNFVVVLGNRELVKSNELKLLVRTGIPDDYRGHIWKGLVHMWTKDYKLVIGSNYYDSLLTSQEYTSRLNPSDKQIELDLLRTLPNNQHYENLDSDGIPKLRRVLLAYSRHDPVVGYCQGLNRLVAITLLFMDEEDAFWCLLAIIKFIMPEGYYTRTLIGSHVDQKVLKDLMAEKMPRLHSHLESTKVDLSLFTFNWFLTVFVDNVTVDVYLRIWDVFLYEGSKVLFRYALAFFKVSEAEILQIKDYLALNKYLRNIAEKFTDIKKLTHIAFNDLNPFPKRMIKSKRAHHYQIIRAQLEELEVERKRRKSGSGEKSDNVDYLSEED